MLNKFTLFFWILCPLIVIKRCILEFFTPCDPMDCSCQAPLSMGFPRQEYWSGLPFPSPGDIPNPGIKTLSPALQVGSLPLSHLGNRDIMYKIINIINTALCYI